NAEKVLTFQLDPVLFSDQGIQNVESLGPLYQDGAHDEDNYSRVIAKIEQEAGRFSRVAVLLPGHPRIGVTIVQRLSHRPDVKTLPGISSFATMLNDLAVDPLERGSVILDVNRLLLYDLKIVPELDHYLYHVCSIGSSATNFSDPSKG